MKKKCFKCEKVKPIEEFYKHPQMPDGHLNKCKKCAKKDVRDNYAAKREQYARYEKERAQTPERKRQAADAQRRRRAKYPDKDKARAAVSRALRTGKLVKPEKCEHCDKEASLQAHHDDYALPLDVTWLCFRCHREHEHGQVVVAA